MYIIVGLGNPGREYEHTRHNAGFDSVTALARSLGVSISKAKCKALVAETRIGSERVVLAQPQTYMNLSGQSVVELLNWYKCEPDHLIVIYDDIDLDAGRLRVRAKGSAGTHNGMRNIIYLLGRDDFPRVRVGVGAPDRRMSLADYVLSRYATPELQKTMMDAFTEAGDAARLIVEQGVEAAVRLVGEQANTQAKEKAKRPSFGALAQELTARVQAGGMPGAACAVSREGRTLYQGVIGLSDPQAGKKLHKDNLFRLGELTRPLTAAAVMILAERGKLALDDPLADYLPDFEHMQVNVRDARGQVTGTERAKRLITLRDLLTHTSGLGADAAGVAAWRALEANVPDEEYGLAGLVPWMSRVPLSFQPGEGAGDSPLEYDALSRVVEVASGMSFATFLNLELFAPLGMGEATFTPAPGQWARMARMSGEAEGEKTCPAFRRNYASGANGLCCPVGEYLRFCQMLALGGTLNGARILSEESVCAMCSVQSDPALPGQKKSGAWGLGVRVCTKTTPEQPLPEGCAVLTNGYGAFFFVDAGKKLCAVGLTAQADASFAPKMQTLIFEALAAAE